VYGGGRAIVSAGNDPPAAPEGIVSELLRRGVDDIIEIADKPFGVGERVVVVGSSFRGFEAIFQRYLSGTERVAILMSAVKSSGLRVVQVSLGSRERFLVSKIPKMIRSSTEFTKLEIASNSAAIKGQKSLRQKWAWQYLLTPERSSVIVSGFSHR